jgi:hypothetical protein
VYFVLPWRKLSVSLCAFSCAATSIEAIIRVSFIVNSCHVLIQNTFRMADRVFQFERSKPEYEATGHCSRFAKKDMRRRVDRCHSSRSILMATLFWAERGGRQGDQNRIDVAFGALVQDNMRDWDRLDPRWVDRGGWSMKTVTHRANFPVIMPDNIGVTSFGISGDPHWQQIPGEGYVQTIQVSFRFFCQCVLQDEL